MTFTKTRRISILFSVILIAFTLTPDVFGQRKNEQKQARALAEQGDKAYRQKDFAGAAELYGRSLAIVPTNPQLHFFKANAHYYLKEYDESEREFAMALTQGFKPVEVYKVRWYLYYDQKKYDLAISDINKALQFDQRNILLLKGLGDVAFQQGDYGSALSGYQKALLITPKDGELYYQVARVYAAQGNIKAQASSAEEAIKRGTLNIGEAYYLLGNARSREKNTVAAIDAYQRAISAKPTIYQVYADLARIYQQENQLTNAIETLKKGLVAFPRDGLFYTDISWYYSLADRPADAVAAAKAATQLLPDQYMGYTNLCRALNETKEYRDAISACNNALRLNPRDGETLFYLGRANDLLGRTREATGYYARAVTGLLEFTKANPDYADGFYLLGNAYFADNQRDRAIESYIKCLEVNRNFVKARYNLGIIYVLKKNKVAAQEQHSFLLVQDASLAAKLKAEIDKL